VVIREGNKEGRTVRNGARNGEWRGRFGSGLDGTFGCGASAQRRREWGTGFWGTLGPKSGMDQKKTNKS